jgi:hypothetical protein
MPADLILRTLPTAVTLALRWDQDTTALIPVSIVDGAGLELWSTTAVAPGRLTARLTEFGQSFRSYHSVRNDTRFTIDGQTFLLAIAQPRNASTATTETREEAAAALLAEDRNSGRELRAFRYEMRESRADRRGRW